MRFRERWRSWKGQLPSVTDWAVLAGVLLMAKGGAEAYQPLAWVIPGLALVAWAIFSERRSP